MAFSRRIPESSTLTQYRVLQERFKKIRSKINQQGLSAIELFVVVIIIGIVAAITARNLVGSTDKTKALALITMSQKMTDNWTLIAQSCGTTSDPASSPVTGNSDSNAVQLLIGGNTNAGAGGYEVPSSHEACYRQSGVLALTDSAQWDGTNNNWMVEGFEPKFSRAAVSGQFFMETQYQDVPDELALEVVKRYIPSLTELGTGANTTYTSVQYGAGSAGVRSVTIRRPIN